MPIIALTDIEQAAARIGRDDLAGDLLVEAGGAPLALPGDIDTLLEALNRAGQTYRIISLLVSERYLESLCAKRDLQGRHHLARSEATKKEVDEAREAPAKLSSASAAGEGHFQVEEAVANLQRKARRYAQKQVSYSLTVLRALVEAAECARARLSMRRCRSSRR